MIQKADGEDIMPPTLLSCGSNAASHLAINHPNDVSVLTPTIYHHSLPPIFPSARILEVVSASAHSLLLLSSPNCSSSDDGQGKECRNILLGVGTNTLGQLGPRCSLWDDVRPEGQWKLLDLSRAYGLEGRWEPVKIAATWTTSFVVYQQVQETSSDGGTSENPKESLARQVIISCGSNDFGELGSSTPVTLSGTPSPIPVSQASQKPTLVDVGLRPGEKVQMIKGGQRHVIVVITGLECQRVMGWGASRKGELSVATLSSVAAAGPSNKAKGKSKANPHPLTSPPTLIDLPLQRGQNVVDIALGASHTIALLSDGSVLGWGSNLKSQITRVHELENVRAIAATWGGSYFLTSDGIYSQGSNTHSQLLRGQASSERGKVNIPEGRQVEKIVGGTEHLLVLARAGGQEEILFAGGWNEHGNLAMGDERDRDALERVELKGKVLGLWGGCASTWVWVDA